MKINNMEIPDYIIKVCQKKEYADALMSGKLYMKASGYFRKLEDTYRGDPYDGRKVMDVGDEEVYLETEDGERLYLNGVSGAKITDMSVGFVDDDKIPIFCATMLNEEIIDITGENSFKIKKEYLAELKKFGEYVVMIPIAELLEKLEDYLEEEKAKIAFRTSPVSYVDIRSRYSPEDFDNDSWEKNLEAFFIKDNAYKMQNEWRIVAWGNKQLIQDDCWVPELKPFQYAVQMEIDNLMEGEFHFEDEVA